MASENLHTEKTIEKPNLIQIFSMRESRTQ